MEDPAQFLYTFRQGTRFVTAAPETGREWLRQGKKLAELSD
jgi:hypothetical protein